MDKLTYARSLMKKARKRMSTFEKKGISTQSIRTLEMQMSLIGQTNRNKSPFSLTKKMSDVQLIQSIIALESYLNSKTSTFTQFKEAGKKLAKEMGIKKPTQTQIIQLQEMYERSDDIIRQDFVYDVVSREMLYTLIHDHGGKSMKVKIAEIIENKKKNIELSNLLDELGIDIDDLL